MIGSFSFAGKGGLHVEVRLADDGTWWSSYQPVLAWLDFMYPCQRNSSPAHGPFGRMVLELAALDFGTSVVPPDGGWPPSDPADIF